MTNTHGTDLDVPRKIGAALRTRREEKKMTQVDLAAAAGISDSYLCHIELGNRAATIKTLEALTAALDMTLNTLMADAGV